MEGIAVNGFAILGIWFCFKDGQILGWLSDLIDRLFEHIPYGLGEWISKPIKSCLFCMPSVWGVCWWFIVGTDYYLPIHILGTCGFMVLLGTIIEAVKMWVEKEKQQPFE